MRAVSCLALAVLALSLGSAAAVAQDAEACANFKWSIAAERAALAAPDLPTLASGAAYPALGRGVAVTLLPEATVGYTVKPARPPKVNPSYGAELSLAEAGGGTLAVTLSDDAWVDVVQGGKVLRSTAFSGKTGCPGVRKSVRFAVMPGPLAIAISNAPAPAIRLDVSRVE